MPDFRRQLMQILVRNHKSDAVLSVIREHVGERQCSKALKFVDMDEEVASLFRRSVYARVRRKTYGSHEKTA